MKTVDEFGIVRRDLPQTLTLPAPPHTPLNQSLSVHQHLKKVTHEFMLNNQECVPTGRAFQDQYCFNEVSENLSGKAVSPPMRSVPALELRETTQNISGDLLAVAKPSQQTQIITLAPQATKFTVSSKYSNPESFRAFRREACKRRWLTRVSAFLAVTLVMICLAYQICAWSSRWQKRRTFLLVQRTEHRDFDEEPFSLVNITMCNANPFRGSAVFELPSGSYLYDTLTGIRTGAVRVPDFAKELSKQSLSTLITISHHLPDMLKDCTINGKICGPKEFQSVINHNRLCHRLSLNSTVREVRLVLNPEEYEYLLPNEAVVGFYLSVDNPQDQVISSRMDMKQFERSIDILQPPPDSDELFVGSQFQTFVQIGFSDILSSPSETAVTSTSRVTKARLVQQWAFLRLENTSTAVVIESLALRLGNLKKDFDGMLQTLAQLRSAQHISPSVDPLNRNYVETCTSPTGLALNTIVNFTEGFNDHLCRLLKSSGSQPSFLLDGIRCNDFDDDQSHQRSSPSESASTLQLFVIQMLFSSPLSANQQINQVLRRQVSLLSIVNQEVHQYHSSGGLDGVESLECTRCERLGNLDGNDNAMSCRRMEQKVKVNMTQHWEVFKKFNQAIATCTQRLDAFNKDMEITRKANLKHIEAFPRTSEVVPSTGGLVSLRIKINVEEQPVVTEYVSFEAITSPISEFLGILTSGVAGLIAIITLWRVVEMKRSIFQRPPLFEQNPSETLNDEVEPTVNYFKASSSGP